MKEFLLSLSSIVIVVFCWPGHLLSQERPKYLDPALPIEQRIDDLLPRMTVAEKVSQISDSWGSVGIPRLKVPSLLKTEGLHSQSYSTGATIFPQPIDMAATFDPDLIRKVGKQTALESKAAHLRESWSPVLDVARDVRWGRVEETYGESPYLVSRMSVAWIEGFQGEGMIAVPKHFAGHGQPMGGRDSQDIGLSGRVMREIHLPSFRAAVEEAHAGGIMAAYGLWEGVPDNASTALLGKILRQEWGFDGIVVSDCGALENLVQKQGIAATMPEAAAMGIVAGVNMNCGSTYNDWAAKALQQGLITESQLDDAVRPLLRAKFRLGLFEHPEPDKMIWEKLPEYDTPEARALAREVAVEGQVLLKNDGALLPLKKDAGTIAVIGPNADTAQTGDYSPKMSPGQVVTVLQGIRSHVAPGVKVLYAPGLSSPLSTDTSQFVEAVTAAKQANVAVVVVGDNSNSDKGESTTGENRDGAMLELPGAQRGLIRAIQATGIPVVLVVINGKPLTLSWEAEHIPAILVTWYPGEEGGNATADLIFGDRNPSGRLPLTWPRSPAQLPLHYDYLPSGRRYDYYDMSFTPQWRFGYGLSYTRFKYSNLRIVPRNGDPGYVDVTADVQNVGSHNGDEVSQLYITDEVSSVATPVVELKGIQRVTLKAGETGTVAFHLTPYDLSLLDAKMVRRVEPGQFRIHVGGVCPDVPREMIDGRKRQIGFSDSLQGVTGEFTEPKEYSARFTYTLDAPATAKNGQPFSAIVTAKNDGNLTDVTEGKLYADFQLASWSFEINPGETKTHAFLPVMYKPGSLTFVAGAQAITREVALQQASARLELHGQHMQVDADSVLHIAAEAQDVGSDPYDGALQLKVDGKPVEEATPLKLLPGEKRAVTLSHAFDVAGIYRVQVNNEAEQQIIVPGGIRFSLQEPLLYAKPEASGSEIRNAVNGQPLRLPAAPSWTAGRNGRALQLNASGMGIEASDLDIYRRAFTLSAWIKIDQLSPNGCVAIFGGRAPMGAGQDNTGTRLQAGVRSGKLFMSFEGREIAGRKIVPTGSWVNVTYTYDPASLRAALYLNGVPDRTLELEPYAGPLETIGDAPDFEHGSYALDEAFIARSVLAPPMVRMLYDKGVESFLHGEFVSHWRSAEGALRTLDAVADIPPGSSTTVTVETSDSEGKVLYSSSVELQSGRRSYSLKGLEGGAAGKYQVRIRVKFSAQRWGISPLVRAVSIHGDGETIRWATPRDWSDGETEPGVAADTLQ